MIIKRDSYPQIREIHKHETIVYCSGNFDLTHARHILFLSKCKEEGDILVVGIGSDYDIKQNKGNNRPIYNEEVRLYTVNNLKPVDYCALNAKQTEEQHRLHSEYKALKLLQPDIYMINDDAYDIPYRQEICKKLGVQLIIGERDGNHVPEFLQDISTTETIDAIDKMGKEVIAPDIDYVPDKVWKEWTKRRPIANGSLVVLNSLDEILLFKRAIGATKGKWESSGGGCNKSETPKETAIRELEEETGITINSYTSPIVELGTFRADNPDKVDIVTVFTTRVKKDTPIKLNEEFSEYQWINIKDAIKSLPMIPTIKEILKTIIDRV